MTDEYFLIVEDHAGVRKNLRQWLAMEFPRYSLLEAATGEEAVELAQEARPVLVLMDIVLPGMNGIEATRRIKEMVPEAHLIMLTAHEDDNYRQGAAAAGASAFIVKGATASDLLPTIAGLLAKNGE